MNHDDDDVKRRLKIEVLHFMMGTLVLVDRLLTWHRTYPFTILRDEEVPLLSQGIQQPCPVLTQLITRTDFLSH